MARRIPLLALLLLSPGLAAAQTTSSVSVAPAMPWGVETCSTQTNVTLTWDVGTVADGTSTFQVYAVSSCAAGTLPSVNTITTQLSTAGQSTGTKVVPMATIKSALSIPTNCATGTDTNFMICVYLVAATNNTILAFASSDSSTTQFQLAVPTAPTGVSALGVEGGLKVSFAAPANSPTAVFQYRIYVADQNGVLAATKTINSPTTSATVTGLQDGQVYTVTVTSISTGGNESPPSTSTQGTPQPVVDFWEAYKGAGGRETGGCATGGAGALAALALLPLVLRRRRA